MNIKTGYYKTANGRSVVVLGSHEIDGKARWAVWIDGRKTPEWYDERGLFRGRDDTPEYRSLKIVREDLPPIEMFAICSGRDIVDVFDTLDQAITALNDDGYARVVTLREISGTSIDGGRE